MWKTGQIDNFSTKLRIGSKINHIDRKVEFLPRKPMEGLQVVNERLILVKHAYQRSNKYQFNCR
jgi:hypothetical protein